MISLKRLTRLYPTHAKSFSHAHVRALVASDCNSTLLRRCISFSRGRCSQQTVTTNVNIPGRSNTQQLAGGTAKKAAAPTAPAPEEDYVEVLIKAIKKRNMLMGVCALLSLIATGKLVMNSSSHRLALDARDSINERLTADVLKAEGDKQAALAHIDDFIKKTPSMSTRHELGQLRDDIRQLWRVVPQQQQQQQKQDEPNPAVFSGRL